MAIFLDTINPDYTKKANPKKFTFRKLALNDF